MPGDTGALRHPARDLRAPGAGAARVVSTPGGRRFVRSAWRRAAGGHEGHRDRIPVDRLHADSDRARRASAYGGGRADGALRRRRPGAARMAAPGKRAWLGLLPTVAHRFALAKRHSIRIVRLSPLAGVLLLAGLGDRRLRLVLREVGVSARDRPGRAPHPRGRLVVRARGLLSTWPCGASSPRRSRFPTRPRTWPTSSTSRRPGRSRNEPGGPVFASRRPAARRAALPQTVGRPRDGADLVGAPRQRGRRGRGARPAEPATAAASSRTRISRRSSTRSRRWRYLVSPSDGPARPARLDAAGLGAAGGADHAVRLPVPARGVRRALDLDRGRARGGVSAAVRVHLRRGARRTRCCSPPRRRCSSRSRALSARADAGTRARHRRSRWRSACSPS